MILEGFQIHIKEEALDAFKERRRVINEFKYIPPPIVYLLLSFSSLPSNAISSLLASFTSNMEPTFLLLSKYYTSSIIALYSIPELSLGIVYTPSIILLV